MFITGCGFKVINNNQLKEFSIADITTTGDKKINFNIRNKLLFNSKDNARKLIKIKLNTTKNKSIKEKNIKNEITKYCSLRIYLSLTHLLYSILPISVSTHKYTTNNTYVCTVSRGHV